MIAQLATYAMAAILVAAMVIECRSGRIPNWLTLIPPVLFVLVVVTAPEPTAMIWQFALGAAVFVFGLVLFFVAGFGAGAVKLMGGAALFIPLNNALYAFGILVAVLFASAFIIVQVRKAFGSDESDWHVLANAVLPMSLPIALATLGAMFVF